MVPRRNEGQRLRVANVVPKARKHLSDKDALMRCERLRRLSQVIVSELDLERILQTVTDFAREECGAQYGAFFHNVEDTAEVHQRFTLSGAPRDAFERLGLPGRTPLLEQTFEGARVVRSDDVRTDPRYGGNPPYYGVPEGHPPVVSYLAVPVVSRANTVLGALLFAHAEPDKFDEDCERFIASIAAHAAIAIENAHLHRRAQLELEQRGRAEARLEMLLDEVKHRYKNAVVTIQAIAAQTFPEAHPDSNVRFAARLSALGKALDLLTARDWDRVAVEDIVARALAPFDPGDRFATSGADASLGSDSSLLLALALHELATNAVKYGALSNGTGRVSVAWDYADIERTRLRICWRESDGPPVAPPAKKGFGTGLIERALGGLQGAATIQFAPEGVVCTFEAPV